MNAANGASDAATVFFVGAGPGAEELLTLRAKRLLGDADLVIAGATGPFAHLCRDDTEVVEATGIELAERVELMTRAAREGRTVVRLFPGDPLVVCRGAEEALGCHEAGVPFEISPGVSAMTGVPAFAGIPLSFGGSTDVRVVDAVDPGVDWDGIGVGNSTVVVAHALEAAGEIAKALTVAGRAPDTPVAMISRGGTTQQSTVISTLGKLSHDLKNAGMTEPALLVVGETVRSRQALSWHEAKPLFGWRVLVPRTKEQAASLSDQLRAYGAVPEEVPTISVEPPRTPQQMDRAVRGLVTGRYQWVAFTSTNAVRAIREKLDAYGLDARAFAGVKIAAVGEQTAVALADYGIRPDLTPPGEQSSEGLLEVWPPYDAELDPIERVLTPRADIATDTLVAGLGKLGWEVEDVTAYRTVRASPPPAPIREAIKGGGFDAVLFTSSSTVRNLIGIAGKPHAVSVIACIGPATAKTAQEYGLRVDVQAPTPSVHELAKALADYGANRRRELLDAGQPVRKPSQKRRRRKTT